MEKDIKQSSGKTAEKSAAQISPGQKEPQGGHVQQNNSSPSPKGKISVGVKIISIVYMVFSGLGLLAGLSLLIGGKAILHFINLRHPALGIVGALIGAGAIALIIISIVGFLAGLYLWKGRAWARILVTVLSGIGFLFALATFPAGIIKLAIHGVILWYLWFNAEAKAYFK